ncbi:cache domain-containing protein [Candidatus Poriferisocius sp.]|uniref:cache domain-containing protein n=1 Tax=Candidatus Poriferisocius sp. TaxID=3101276 RepID=UPI003B59E8F0
MRGHRRLAFVAALATVVLLLGGLTACGNDDDGGSTQPPPKTERDAYTKWFVQQAVDRFEQTGRQASIDHFNNEAGSDGQWYTFVLDLNGVVLAHPTVPENVGMTTGEILGGTAEALATEEEMVTATETGKWVDYHYLNPQSGGWETKHTWIVRRDDILIASGWYESN